MTASVGLYIFGLFVAFLARPPVTITDQMQTTYFAKMEAADAHDAAPRAEAERALLAAQRDVKRAQGWFWYFNPDTRARVAALRVVEVARRREAGVYRAVRARAAGAYTRPLLSST